MSPITAEDYKYVATLGYFTPRSLPGAAIPTAEEVAALLKKGATMYDTRTLEEYNTRRIQGARFVPYIEKSRKELGYEEKLDSFDMTKIEQDRNAHVIFACNGAECWKSYKAAQLAVKAGYKNVYWFRGGFPEWSIAGLPTDSSPTAVAQK